jgi:ribosome maturation factor RimP
MEYKTREDDIETASIRRELEPVIDGLGCSLVELNFFRRGKKGRVQIRLVITKPGLGTDDLGRVHRAILPRLELALKDTDLYVEVSSPGTDRLIREGEEFRHYPGKRIRCYRTDASKWCSGVLRSFDTEKILLETEEGMTELSYKVIAKAALCDAPSGHPRQGASPGNG